MGILENKAVAMSWLDCTDLEVAKSITDEDCRCWILGLGLVSRDDLIVMWIGGKDLRVSSESEVFSITAEEDRVSIEMSADYSRADGVRYANMYHLMFIIKNGKITELREYQDTAYMNHIYPNFMKMRDVALRPTTDEYFEGAKASIENDAKIRDSMK